MTLSCRTVLLLVSACSLAACTGDETIERKPKANEPSDTQAGAGGGAGSAGTDGFGNSDASTADLMLPDGAVLDSGSDPGKQPDDDDCGRMILEPMVNTVVEPGNLIVVFDNSGSMTSLWGDSPRWLVAANALRDAVTSLSEYLTVGAILFPTDASCAVATLDSGQQIPMLPGSAFVIAWDNFLRTNAPSGGTPLGEAMIAADAALAASSLGGTTDVIVLTDGEPTCTTTALTALPAAWLTAGTRTHVVGLPGSETANATLEQIAAAGGTMTFLRPENARALRRQIATIASEIVKSALESCTIPLEAPPPDLDKVYVVVTEGGKEHSADRDLGEGGGWSIASDGSEIELFGAFCDRGLEGEYQRIDIQYGCIDLPPLPPPKGPE